MSLIYFLLLIMYVLAIAYPLLDSALDRFMWSGAVVSNLAILWIVHTAWILHILPLSKWPQDLGGF